MYFWQYILLSGPHGPKSWEEGLGEEGFLGLAGQKDMQTGR